MKNFMSSKKIYIKIENRFVIAYKVASKFKI